MRKDLIFIFSLLALSSPAWAGAGLQTKGQANGIQETSTLSRLQAVTATPERGRIGLNGTWEYIAVPDAQSFDPLTNRTLFPKADSPFPPVRTDEKPPQGAWTSVPIPSAHAVGYIQPKIAKLWYRRTFTVPLEWRDRQVQIEFAGASFEVVVYVNDQLIGWHRGDSTSFAMDITKACRFGKENRLLVRVWCPAIEYGKVWPQALLEDLEWGRKGIWDEVWLQARPATAVESVFCRPSFREKRLETEVVFANDSGQDVSVAAECVVLDSAGREVLKLGVKPITIKAQAKASHTFVKEWAAPRIWMPDDPYLYLLETRLSRDGKRIDTHRERFGFRESWIHRGDFYLNGKIMHYHRHSEFLNPMGEMNNRTYWREYFRFKKALGYNLIRTFRKANPTFLEIADEEGICVVTQSGWHHPDNPLTEEFKTNARPVLREWVTRDRNHPCLVMWCAENEGYQNIESIVWVISEMRKLDPTRPIDADSSYFVSLYDDKGNLKNVPWAQIANAHYPLTAGLGSYSLTQATAYPARWAQTKTKPAVFGEWGDFQTPGVQVFGPHEYEKVMELTRLYFHGQGVSDAGVMAYLEGIVPYWRKLGLSGENNWLFNGLPITNPDISLPENWFCRANADLLAPLLAFFPDKTRGVYGGTRFQRQLCIVNDTMNDVSAEGEVRLVLNGKEAVKTKFKLAVPQGQSGEVPVVFNLPNVAARTPACVEIRFAGATVRHHGLPLDLDIFPPYTPPTVVEPSTIGLYDPKGSTQAAFKTLGIPFVQITNPADLPVTLHTAVIGRECLNKAVVKASPAWLKFAENGGTIICLNQKDYIPWLPVQLTEDKALEVPAVWMLAEKNPLFAGLDEADLSWWANDRSNPAKVAGTVAVRPYIRPSAGRVRSLLECGNSLDRSALLELRLGKGVIFLSQLEMIPVAGISPGADLMLRRLVTASATELPTRQVWFAGDGLARNLLKDKLGIGMTDLAEVKNRNWSDRDLIVWMPGEKPLAPALGQLAQKAVEQGAVLLAVASESGLLPPMSEPPEYRRAIEYKDKVYVFQAQRHPNFGALGAEFIKMAVVDRDQELVDGLSTVQMYRPSEWLSTGKLADFEVAPGRGWNGMTRPAVIAHRRQKNDQIVLTVAREPDGSIGLEYERMVHTLLINLGAASRDSRIDLVGEGKYFTIDLRPYCTMGFADDKEDDGRGGWSDQGPQNDLRNLPIGRQEFFSVPFDIIDPAQNNGKSCVVLGSESRLKNLPRQVTNIRFGNRKAAYLYFLHTGAFGGDGGEYRVRYTRATEVVEKIPLTGLNIGDWWSPADRPQAPVAWTGINGANRVGLYMFTWKNPHPELVLESIDFISDGQGPVLGLFAVSGRE